MTDSRIDSHVDRVPLEFPQCVHLFHCHQLFSPRAKPRIRCFLSQQVSMFLENSDSQEIGKTTTSFLQWEKRRIQSYRFKRLQLRLQGDARHFGSSSETTELCRCNTVTKSWGIGLSKVACAENVDWLEAWSQESCTPPSGKEPVLMITRLEADGFICPRFCFSWAHLLHFAASSPLT